MLHLDCGVLLNAGTHSLGTAIANRPFVDIERLEIITLLKKHVAIAVSLIVTFLSLALPSAAKAQSDSEKVRAKVRVLSASSDLQTEVRFRDKTKVKGHITSVDPVSFTLKDSKDGTSRSIAYSEVESVNKAGGGVSTKTWLIIPAENEK